MAKKKRATNRLNSKSSKPPTAPKVDLLKDLKDMPPSQRATICHNEVLAVLNKWKCRIDVSMLVKHGNVSEVVNIVAMDITESDT